MGRTIKSLGTSAIDKGTLDDQTLTIYSCRPRNSDFVTHINGSTLRRKMYYLRTTFRNTDETDHNKL